MTLQGSYQLSRLITAPKIWLVYTFYWQFFPKIIIYSRYKSDNTLIVLVEILVNTKQSPLKKIKSKKVNVYILGLTRQHGTHWFAGRVAVSELPTLGLPSPDPTSPGTSSNPYSKSDEWCSTYTFRKQLQDGMQNVCFGKSHEKSQRGQ